MHAEIASSQLVELKDGKALRSLNLEPGQVNLPITVIRTNDFENLVHALVPLIGSVNKGKNESLTVEFTNEPSWVTGVVPTSDEAKAGVALVARSATYMAARLKLNEGHVSSEMTIIMRELSVNATYFLTKHPWFSNFDTKFGMRPISIVLAMRNNPDYLISELRSGKSKNKKAATSFAAIMATALACDLAAPGPSPIVFVENQSESEIYSFSPTTVNRRKEVPYVSANRPVTENPETSRSNGFTFGELWRTYLDVQLSPERVKGKAYDFDRYCIQFSNGCGANVDDPKQYFGEVAGFYSVQQPDGTWLYFEIDVSE